MIQSEDHRKAMLFDHPRNIPVSVAFLPATRSKYRERLDELASRHPVIFGAIDGWGKDYDTLTGQWQGGKYVDAWGCGWDNIQPGMVAIVTSHPITTRAAVHTFKAPATDEGLPHGFMFLRLCDLRGFEEMMVDFAEEPPELQMLIDIVLAYNMRQMDRLLTAYNMRKMEKPVTGPVWPEIVSVGDDLGIQTSLPISPAKWRKYLKPCYRKLYERCHAADYPVYMHTDGHIYEIIPDLAECGVDVINPQFRANGLENLARTCKGKICVDLDLDRQMFPFCKPRDIDAHVREAVEKLGSPEGGLWLKAECGPDIPLENIEAICAALEKYRSYFA